MLSSSLLFVFRLNVGITEGDALREVVRLLKQEGLDTNYVVDALMLRNAVYSVIFTMHIEVGEKWWSIRNSLAKVICQFCNSYLRTDRSGNKGQANQNINH